MNTDVLGTIACFCDIDGRRALGIGPRPVKRNVEFGERLQGIHRAMTTRVSRNSYEGVAGTWCDENVFVIRLNCKMTVRVVVNCDRSHASVTTCTWDCWPCACSSEYTCFFRNNGRQRAARWARIDCAHFPSRIQRTIRADLTGGQWKVDVWGQSVPAIDFAALRKLGYTLYRPPNV
jgi:hypothetical protein